MLIHVSVRSIQGELGVSCWGQGGMYRLAHRTFELKCSVSTPDETFVCKYVPVRIELTLLTVVLTRLAWGGKR